MKNKKQNKIAKIPASIDLEDGQEFLISNFEVTDSPIHLKFENLPKSFIHKIRNIHDEIDADPKRAIEKLEALKEEYPDVAKLNNYLAGAYSRVGNYARAREISFENYIKHPDYLFAKLNYAQLCLNEGDYYRIPAIFDNNLDLKLLYPHRNKFHVTEFVGFTGVLCAYYACAGDKKLAALLYKSLEDFAPEADMVRFARQFIYPSLRVKILNWLGKKVAKAEQRNDDLENIKISK